MGITLALGLVDRHGPVVLRAVRRGKHRTAAATTYFTFSRGSWIALTAGVAWVIMFSPTRLRYLATALLVLPLPVLAVAYAASLPALTADQPQLSQIGDAGSRAAVAIGATAAASAAIAAGLALAQSHIAVPRRARQVFAGAVIVVTLAGALGGISHYGSPVTRAHQLYRSLTAPPVGVAPTSSLDNRLLSASLNGRQYLWRVALDQIRRSSNRRGRSGHIPRLLAGAPPVAHLCRQRAQPVP